jgi:hypothetical protein
MRTPCTFEHTRPRAPATVHAILLAAGGLALSGAWAPPAHAELGGQAESVAPDAAQFHAQARVSTRPAFTIHEIDTPAGTVIREFVAPSGTVFAVSWQGPFKPDLRALLGSHYQRYASTPRTTGSSHSRLMIDQPDFVVHEAGHARYFSGLAYLPQQLPAGVGEEQLQ